MARLVKNLTARDAGLIPGSGRSPGKGYGNPLQDSGLGNPMDRGAWWATAHGGHKESDMTEHTCTHSVEIYSFGFSLASLGMSLHNCFQGIRPISAVYLNLSNICLSLLL